MMRFDEFDDELSCFLETLGFRKYCSERGLVQKVIYGHPSKKLYLNIKWCSRDQDLDVYCGRLWNYKVNEWRSYRVYPDFRITAEQYGLQWNKSLNKNNYFKKGLPFEELLGYLKTSLPIILEKYKSSDLEGIERKSGFSDMMLMKEGYVFDPYEFKDA